jgi:hypothetical protein
MSKYDVPVWKMCEDAAKELPETFSVVDIIEKIREKYPNVNNKTIRCIVYGCSPNHTSSKYYPVPSKLFFYLGKGRFRLLNQGEENITVEEESCVEDEENEEFSFQFEEDLKLSLSRNLKSIEEGLILYKDANGNGLEYPTDVGRIDILSLDSEGNFVVIELKVGLASEKVCGQIQKYMGWVKQNLAKGRGVRGIIIARVISEPLKYAASVSNIKTKEYEMNFNLKNVEMLVGNF